ncbi:MAG: PDZ domain-containing protein [Blastocatellia bacterium]|nr:PDZ domain-containing protein [Blastocatellia bacterium]
MFRAFLACVLVLIATSFSYAAGPAPQLLRMPTANRTHIVFVFAGDLWSVPREGGVAERLTTGIGIETAPQFSPDGQSIAFTGEYDGNVDVYVMPAKGGTPRRVTYHPNSDTLAGWSPDGKNLLFASTRTTENFRTAQLFTIPVNGTFPTALPLPMAFEGSFSADGSQLAYVPVPRAFNAWKRYRGGLAAHIWVANLADSSVVKVPRTDSNDFNPMWIGDKVYFLSDRNGPITLFSYDVKTQKVTQVLENKGLDFKAATASASGGVIAYEQFGSINLYDLQSGTAKKVEITIEGDMPGVRPRFDKVGEKINGAAISPTGMRAVFEARGEILTVPAEKGDIRNLTNTTGVAERDPSWSPDGKWIAYFSEESGEYALHLRSQNGQGEVRKIDLGKPPSFFYSPTWSPDSKKIAYADKRQNLWYVEVEKGSPVKVTYCERGLGPFKWAPDSQWIVYARALPSYLGGIFVYSLTDGKNTQITDGLSDAGTPAFDRSGKYLYFTASTDIGPKISGFDMSAYAIRPSRSVYVCVLKKGDPSPLAPQSDEEKIADDKSAEGKKDGEGDKKDGDKKEETPKVVIDFENLSQRILALPVPAGNYQDAFTGKANQLFLVEGSFDGGDDGPPPATLHKFDLEKRKVDKILEGTSGVTISANGEKILFRMGNNWFISGADQPVKPGDGKLKTEAMQVYVDPREEWKQMYRETWRIERDFFYDPNYHGLNIAAAEKKYAPYVEGLAHRTDLNYLFNEMLGELTVGHLYVNGGDQPTPKRTQGGLLGADYAVENGRYKFAKVYDGENWNPGLRAPLTQPGAEVKAGEYLLAVNGRSLMATDNIYAFFEETAGKQTLLKVGPNADGSNAREVTVVPVGNEGALRNLAWIEANRRKVDQMSGGKLAYVWLPDTAGSGYTNFNRYFFAQLNREGAIIDERFNRGGHAADYVIDYLKKPLMSHWTGREGLDFRQPFGTLPGPKAMLANEYSGSGGDYLPWMFHREKLGYLIGKRTWGGLVGIGGYPSLLDGGSVTAPSFAFYSPEGKWEVENHGVSPDIEIDMDPKLWRQGRDPQLEKAIELLLEDLKKSPAKQPVRPPYPNYHK